MTTTVTAALQLRKGTAAQWTSANPTLLSGEIGYETDTQKQKVGDGTTAWTALAYYHDPDNITDHGALTGLSDDDHSIYHTDARGDARYTAIAHASNTNNPHSVSAAQVGADATGTAAGLIASHEAALDPHPGYLTPAEGNAAYSAIGHDHSGTYEPAGTVATHAALTTVAHGISAFGATLVDDADAATARTTLGLGTAATTAASDYAVAAKGVTNGDTHDHSGGDGAQIAYSGLSGLPTLGTAAATDSTAYATAAQGATADTALQPIVSASGLTMTVNPFSVDGITFTGGAITIPADGDWYIGLDLFRQIPICLPRLGHTGWIPLAFVNVASSAVTEIRQIAPVIPSSRLPNTIKKLIAGQAIKVVVMGSSLVEGTGDTVWAGMLFSATSNTNDYSLRPTTFINIGLGGAPNHFQFAQLGNAVDMTCNGYISDGYPLRVSNADKAPNGRSNILDSTDLVVIGVLANGGDYRLQNIDPIVRRLRERNIEVILVTDNGENLDRAYVTMADDQMYFNGISVIDVSQRYGCELADTAAYVFDAHLRYENGIYRDAIHMSFATPAGRTAAPSCGYEVWARAIRSVIHADAVTYGTTVYTNDFSADDGLFYERFADNTDLLIADGVATLTWIQNGSGGLVFQIPVPLNIGDTVVFQYTTTKMSSGNDGFSSRVEYLGTASNNINNIPSTGNLTFTITKYIPANDGNIGIVTNSGTVAGFWFTLDNVTITINSSVVSGFSTTLIRQFAYQQLPDYRLWADYKIAGDYLVTLPVMERNIVTLNAVRGTLGASPRGANSFARRFYSATSASEDLLTLTAGQSASLGGHGCVGYAIIRSGNADDDAVSLDVFRGSSLVKNMTIAASGLDREIFVPILTNTDFNRTVTHSKDTDSIKITVVSGTLRIAALITMTADVTYISAEEIMRVGTWTAKEQIVSSVYGHSTDTLNDYAFFRCPGNRLQWIIAGKSVSKPVNTWCENQQSLAEVTSGTNHVYLMGGHVGKNKLHYIQCNETLAGGSTSGRALTLAGAVVINDR